MTMTESTPVKFSTDTMVNGVPAGWRPTKEKPVPVVRCTATARGTGNRCRRHSVRGLLVCQMHGGQLPNPKEHAAAIVDSARMRLFGLAEDAVEVLYDLMQEGVPEAIRLKSAESVLDRDGLNSKQEISVEVTTNSDPAETVKAKLSKLITQPPALDSAETIDAEIIEDQETLF